MRTFLVGFILLFSSALASATCYVGAGIGATRVTELPTTGNDRFLARDRVEGSYSVDGKGNTQDMFLGCTLPNDFAVEAGYMRGLVAQVDTTGRYVVPELKGLGIPFTVMEDARVRMYTLSMLKDFPVSPSFSVFGRLGVEHTKADLILSVPLGKGYSLQYAEVRSVTGPYLGLGVALGEKRGLRIRAELKVYAPQVREMNLAVLYPF